MKRIAIITGATGGIGAGFVRECAAMDDVDEVWAIGRNKKKLEALKGLSPKVVTVEADLNHDGVDTLEGKIRDIKSNEGLDISFLINDAGVAYMGEFEKMSTEEVERFCKINCSVPSEIISICLPYMHDGSKILNISSASSFQPNPYLTMYSASKVFLTNFSRALGLELRSRGITVTCVCPYWVDTEMLPRTGKDGKKIKYTGMISADRVVKKALRDSRLGRDMSVPGFFANYFRFYAKIMPTSIVMRQWIFGIRNYI